MKFFNVSIVMVVLAVVVLLLNNGCGKRNASQQTIATPTPQVTIETGSKQPQQLSDVLAQLEALATPEGVDAALFQRLKDRLREELVERFGEKGVCKAPPEEEPRNQVQDLHYIGKEPGEVVNHRINGMQWCYRNLGDYDQDGVVAIADITPLAIHYGESVPDDDNSIQAVLNGCDDDVLDEEDIIGIASNYGCRADYFGFRGSDDPESLFDESTQWDLEHIGSLDNRYPYDAKLRRQRLQWKWSHPPTYYYHYRYWKVVAHDIMEEEELLRYGPLSNMVDMQLHILGVGRSGPWPFTSFNDWGDAILVRPSEERVFVGARKVGAGGDPPLGGWAYDTWGVLNYLWEFGGAATRNPNPYLAVPQLYVTDQIGVYPDCWVVVTNGFAGEKYYFTIIVDTYPWVYNVTPKAGDPGAEVEFAASIDPPETEPDSYYWEFGDEPGWATPRTSAEAQPTVTLTNVLGEYSGTVTIVAGEWEQVYPFDFAVGVAPDVATVEFEGWSDNPEFEGPLEGDIGTGANLKVIRHPGVEPPTPPVSYEWDISGGVYPNEGIEADDSFEVMLVESGTYLGSVVITNALGTADKDFSITVHKDKVYMYTFPPDATLSRDEPVRVVVAVEDLGHEWYKQITTVYYDDTITVDSWNWGSPGGPGPGEPGDSDGIWQLLGVPNDLICSLGMGDGPRQAHGWMLIDGEEPPLDKWAFYRYLRPLGEFNEVEQGSSGDVFNFNITLNAGIEPGNEPPDVTLEFLSVFFNLELGVSGQMFDATCYWDTSYHCPERFMDIGTGLTIPVTP